MFKAERAMAAAAGQSNLAPSRFAPVNESTPISAWRKSAPRRSASWKTHVLTSCHRARRMRWASLLQHVFEVDALRCPRCGSTMRLIAAIEDPTVARKILECLMLPARAPPLEPAAPDTPDLGQAEGDWLFDQSPVHDEP